MTTYTEEEKEAIFDDILEEIMSGRGIGLILKDPGMPRSLSFYQWLEKSENWQERYAQACVVRQELLFDQMLQVAKNQEKVTEVTYDHNGFKEVIKDNVPRSNLLVNTMKWQLEKLNPKKYGAKLDVTTKDKEITASNPVWNFVSANKEKE